VRRADAESWSGSPGSGPGTASSQATPGRPPSGALVTVLHNGVLVQDDVELSGPTAHRRRPPCAAGPEKRPLSLQDHGSAVRYRNIWIWELSATAALTGTSVTH
jgi:Domain of Unknown Function (DUF1080)